MSRKYLNPPIIEVVCEFHLPPDSPWDIALPELIYERIKSRFPQREQRLLPLDVDITRGPEGLRQEIRIAERAIFYQEDRRVFVQVGHRFIAINSLRPYPSWKAFKEVIKYVYEVFTEVVNVDAFEKMGLGYINQILLPQQTDSKIKIEDYFEFYPHCGSHLPQTLANFSAFAAFPFEEERDICSVHLSPGVPPVTEEGNIIVLGINYALAKPKTVRKEDTLEWVEKAHSRLEEIFEGCITDRLRELFQEVRE